MGFTTPDWVVNCDTFAPGFIDSPEKDKIPPGATPDARNCMWVSEQVGDAVRAILRKRYGCALVHANSMQVDKKTDGLWSFSREAAASELVAVVNGTLYKSTGAVGAVWSALSGGTGFTAGNRANFLQFKNNLFIMDGVKQLRYDGSACYPVGAAAPTNAITLATSAGPGVTGTYEGYWVGYDPVIDHETSPSPFSSAVVFANQQRLWTRPAHVLPANYTFWRVYARRTDTSEANYYRVGTVAIATGTLTESVSDAARVDIGPAVSSNDAPPVFQLAEEFKGYRLGVPISSSDMYVSKLLDPESQNAKDKFPIGGKGDDAPVRSLRKFGTGCIARKATKSYRISGERVPFQIDPIQNSMGACSQKSGVEVDGWWYDWDQQRGPYRTELTTWESLATGRVQNAVNQANKLATGLIECVYDKTHSLVIWNIPTSESTTRVRRLMAYHTRFQRWMPIISGLEYQALTTHNDPDGNYGVFFGDCYSRVWRLFSGEKDAPLPATTLFTVVSATNTTVTSTGFYTDGTDGLAGCPILHIDSSGNYRSYRVKSNTATVVSLDSALEEFSPIPVAGDTLIIGGIYAYWYSPKHDAGNGFVEKTHSWLYLRGAATTPLTFSVYLTDKDGTSTLEGNHRFTLPTTMGLRSPKKRRVNRKWTEFQFYLENIYADQPFELAGYVLQADYLRGERADSA